MADGNVVANPGVGGAAFKVDNDGTQNWPYSKLAWGPSGTQNEVDDADGKRLPVQIRAAASGGFFKVHVVAAATVNATSIKAAPGQLYRVRVFNNAAYPIYVKFHDTAVAPTAGVGVVETIGQQAGTGDIYEFGDIGDAFATGIGMTIVKGLADGDATAVSANDCVVDVFYK